jgi:hypothetical protein
MYIYAQNPLKNPPYFLCCKTQLRTACVVPSKQDAGYSLPYFLHMAMIASSKGGTSDHSMAQAAYR